MLVYLLKVTIIWGVFLLLFEGFYKQSKWFNTNRFFLVFALLAGIVLPLIPWAFPQPVARVAVVNSWNIWGGVARPAGATPGVSTQTFDWKTVVYGIYGLGLFVVLVMNVREIIGIIRTAVYGNHTTWNEYRVFTGDKPHAPYSFMGWIFIYKPEQYAASGLEYLIRHEQAHVRNKHWLDLSVLQIFCILFWFHPMVWRYRHLLKLTHEYQADEFAAAENHYEYGHFLLEQTLLTGAPSIAHSFYFSSLKNRIKMLTRTQTRMRSGWRYAAVIPALFGCTFLMAQDRSPDSKIKKGNITFYRGNTFEWAQEAVDSVIVEDPVSGERGYQTSSHSLGIVRVNQEGVFPESEASIPAQYRAHAVDFSSYLTQELKSRSTVIPDSVAQIQIINLVVDKKGKIIYYDVLYLNEYMHGRSLGGFSSNPVLDPIIEKIVDNSGNWAPAMKDGKPVNEFIAGASGVVTLKPLHFRVQVSPDVFKQMKKDGVLKD